MTGDIKHLLSECRKGERLAQKQFYQLFRSKMFVLCLRFANNREDAEDLLQEGFVRVFLDLHQYKGAGNLEGWVRKVFLNTCLQYIRKQKKVFPTEYLDNYLAFAEPQIDNTTPERGKELIQLLQKMPAGYRAVINLYVLEGYTHAAIGEELGISENTSKSQYSRARTHLKGLLKTQLSLPQEKIINP
ncbi:MAG: sigma-70 family RNA polymerase sigma factor [Saprospiraceae bacterium]|nr:sigma-70 family RNA polymerase sigma factor [Saprospiraceae bacterium]